MNFLNQGIENKIDTIIKEQDENYCQILKNILLELYKNIPDNKRISYGRVHTLKVLVKKLTEKLKNDNEKVFLLGKKYMKLATIT